MTQRRLYLFEYVKPDHPRREGRACLTRDGIAGQYLAGALARLGYFFEGPIFQYPSDVPTTMDLTFLHPTDLILLTTRPPMSDAAVRERRKMPRALTNLEDLVFGVVRPWVAVCSRARLEVTAAAAAIDPEIARCRYMRFFQNGGGAYRSHAPGPRGPWTHFERAAPRTAGFLVYSPQAWEGGPACLVAWSAGGYETLAWCYFLATRYPHLLCTTPFAVGQMKTRRVRRPLTIDFVRSWDVTHLSVAPSTALDTQETTHAPEAMVPLRVPGEGPPIEGGPAVPDA